MMKSFTAYTSEIDDLDLCAKEISHQLNPEQNMQKNTVGILACNYEFVLSGAAKSVCDALPFPVVGTITTAQAVKGESGILLLTVMMLTSDDVELSISLTDPLAGDPTEIIGQSYRAAAAQLSGDPALIIALAPFIPSNSGDAYVDILTKASGGVPCFGTLAVDDSSTFENCYSILDGVDYRDRMVLLLLSGDIHPQFHIATISDDKILRDGALITSSDGHILKEVNGRPVVEFFEKMGLTNASESSYAMTSLPFMVDYNDGTPMVSKVFICMDEQGNAICAGAMPEGSTLYLGVFDRDDVLLTTTQSLKKALENKDVHNMLIYSCVSRSMSLGGEVLLELETIQDKLGDSCGYMAAYSGGEICPTQISQNLATNRFHNNAFIVCAF